ncbi:MAG: hypothetical protein ACXAC7_05030 [Candidatus Hodarchaeales archaeon]
MAVITNSVTITRIKHCPKCSTYRYHDYTIEYPSRVFVCHNCGNQERHFPNV